MRRLKKFKSGEAAQYVSRKQALKKLQLSLNDFRRLCIIKGIYPREPKHRRKAQKGSSDIKILYHAKDIKFLLHEPIVWTLRDYKIFHRRTGRDRALRDFKKLKRRLDNAPELKIDHIVKERYPTFIDAIKDLDDCLTLLFLFSTFPSMHHVPRHQSDMCRRLTIEFMHAVIASKALRKVFISIKGYYFQAEIKGQKVTWIIPHYYPFAPQPKSEVDFKVMSTFVEFYTIMLGFVNYRLFHGLNLIYPPEFATPIDSEESKTNETVFVSERIAALNSELCKVDSSIGNGEENDFDLDLLNMHADSDKVKRIQEDAVNERRLQNLFKGLRIFINREVPREPLVFIIRCLGGKVSWDRHLFTGSSFDETDETITHQIVDRPCIEKQYISRDYIQPQWVFDCVNQKKLLPTNSYFIGAELPPHLSPFVEDKREEYIPPEEKALRDPSLIETHVPTDDEEDEVEEESPSDVEDATEAQKDARLEEAFRQECNDLKDGITEPIDDKTVVEDEAEQKRVAAKQKMAVQAGTVHKDDPREAKRLKIGEDKLMARMVKGKHRNLYRKLVREERTQGKEKWLLEKKRRRLDDETKMVKKNKRLEERAKNLQTVI